jgi:hypothetical protein
MLHLAFLDQVLDRAGDIFGSRRRRISAPGRSPTSATSPALLARLAHAASGARLEAQVETAQPPSPAEGLARADRRVSHLWLNRGRNWDREAAASRPIAGLLRL